MKRCGLKLTHDGGVAVLDGRDLVACIEMEKLTNNERYRRIEHTDEIALALHRSGFQPSDIDEYIIDGWDGEVDAWVELLGAAGRVQLKVAPYVEKEPDRANEFTQGFGLNILGRDYTYKSAPHVMGHIASVYCTSPFAIFKQKALCLVWDGSIWPRLYEISDGGIRFINTLFPMIGHAYACAGHHFGPYKNADRTSWKLDLAGKLMSYMSTGTVDSRITAAIQTSYQNNLAGHSPNALSYRRMSANTSVALIQTHRFFEEIGVLVAGAPEHDILATFHYFVERLLIETLRHELARAGRNMSRNLCISGGCGLNIKWNSALRSSGLFRDVWVSPFPNDSGSAIGAACSALVANDGLVPINWSVFSGPHLVKSTPDANWRGSACELSELAALLADGEPVVFLAGRAELGPRALGARSILAPASDRSMKDRLNAAKQREYFRPVAPICLEDRAPEIFEPGSNDRYMLYDHKVREGWRDRVPAIMHLDGSARVQTIARTSAHPVAKLLVEYEKLTNIPLLCNTSANALGRGFFPDVASACTWGRIAKVWAENVLWSNDVDARIP